ncbi:hypothetical protein AZE42_10281 [Rhizopogon vesiculosus]|uniref:Uncharacterized protein n=1 Tax=Rhizopogon vesiculosus TaxID=180088 RepID=A0A1J8QDF7_9AGAM|nr:hypothetical protein AZE42_10281 [Rhizopogon vesiculosus]
MDGTEIGLFGALRLMKRTTNEQVATFPIDEETVTFERDPTCSVRLYYPDVSPLHAKIAFLIVLGEHMPVIDDYESLYFANIALYLYLYT